MISRNCALLVSAVVVIFWKFIPIEGTSEEISPAVGSARWLTELFEDAELIFDMSSQSISESCRNDYAIFKAHVNNQTVWAVRMLESAEWPVVGLLAGRKVHFGNYGECLKASGPGIESKYCLVESILSSSANTSAWNTMTSVDIARPTQFNIKWAMCIPASCTAEDLQLSLNSHVYPVFQPYGIDITVSVDPLLCQTSQPKKFIPEYHMIVYIFFCIIAVVILASAYDYLANETVMKEGEEKDNPTGWSDVISSVSMRKSMDRLVEDSSSASNVFHCIRTCVTILLVILHAMSLYYSSPMSDTEDIELSLKSEKAFHNMLVNILFLINGYVIYSQGSRLSEETTNLTHTVWSASLRWLNLLPVLGFILLYWTTRIPYLGSGPFWQQWIDGEVKLCRSYWWMNILGLQNFLNSSQMCFPVSFYMTVDFHLHLIGSVLLYHVVKNAKCGMKIVAYIFLLLAGIQFLQSHFGASYDPLADTIILNHGSKLLFENSRSCHRIPVYLLGLMTAYVVDVLKNKKYEFSTVQKYLLVILSIAVGKTMGTRSNEIFTLLPVAVILCIYLIGDFCSLSTVIELKAFVVVGRLSPSVLLISGVIQQFHYKTQRVMLPDSLCNLIWWTISDITFAMVAAFVLFIFIEGPTRNIIELLGNRQLVKTRRLPPNMKSPTIKETSVHEGKKLT